MNYYRFLKLIFIIYVGIFYSNYAYCSDLKLENEVEKIKIKVKLNELYAKDQTVRNELNNLLSKGYSFDDLKTKSSFMKYWEKIDRKNLTELQEIISKWGWPSISRFGEQADQEAFLIVQHADYDVVFQKKILALLKNEMKNKDTNPQNIAYLSDRVNVNNNKLQLYGTQGVCTGHYQWAPRPIYDIENLNKRRQTIGLENFSLYIKQVSQFCP